VPDAQARLSLEQRAEKLLDELRLRWCHDELHHMGRLSLTADECDACLVESYVAFAREVIDAEISELEAYVRSIHSDVVDADYLEGQTDALDVVGNELARHRTSLGGKRAT